MDEKKKEKVPPFKDIWTPIPMDHQNNEIDTVTDWLQHITKRNRGREEVILIVEDEREITTALQEILEYEGYRTKVASNGIEALELLSRANYNLVLSDIRMPAMDGIELCQICKEHPQLNHIPIILFSGYYDSFESCADYFLAKPIESQVLLNVLQKIFEKYQSEKHKETLKIGKEEIKPKHFQMIPVDHISIFSNLKNLLDFVWIFQPKNIPLLQMSYKSDLTIAEIRNVLQITEQQDTILIVEESPIIRELLKSEITFLGGNPERIFSSIDRVKQFLNLK
ncbi:MAG TPA: response regulator [Candidatus Deferrimicrobium sp.]|nr:response regulator [Candidatus Deferrimicrobium sp.]